MVGPALRSLAVAGALTLTWVAGGVPLAAPAVAQPGDSGASSQGTDDPGDTGGEDSGGTDPAPNEPEAPSEPDDPSEGSPAEDPDAEAPAPSDPEPEGGGGSTVDPGRDDPADPPPMRAPAPRVSDFSGTITIPWFRLPAPGEIPAGSWPTASTFYTTVAIPVPTLTDFLEALRVVPAPQPAPGPAFRTQEEAPVADATSGTTTGGGGGGGGGMSGPVVFRAPLVTVPRSTTVAGRPTKLPPGSPATGVAPGVTQPGVAGVPTPAIRGSVRPTPGVTAPLPATPASGLAPRTSVSARGVTQTTVAEIAAVAVPGVAGLLFLTFSGGMIGYRQANSVRYVRTAGAERFLP